MHPTEEHHNAVTLDISYKKKTVRNTNTWRLNSTFLNNQQVTEEIKGEIKNFLETNDNENTPVRLCLLVGAFNPFTFKVIIAIYVPIAIFLIVCG